MGNGSDKKEEGELTVIKGSKKDLELPEGTVRIPCKADPVKDTIPPPSPPKGEKK